ncbi:hypothetical protein BYT27DRAFT_7238045 [Phlegmacium glaucopus]|nr:hypothetical protein BYT27DRAFT_7238045 [Phlegmacium glaucopus]
MSNLAVLQDACIVAAYMKRKFPSVLVSTLDLQGPNVEIEHPPGWSVEFALEVDLALDVIARAFHNQVSTEWDVRRYADHLQQTNEHFLKVSLDLMKENPTCEWLKKSRSLFALMGGILSIVQPELFDLGVQALQLLESDPEVCDNPERLQELLGIWHMPFSALSVISNRVTPLHCDTGGRAEWMDLMLALGEYDNGRFGVPAFGYTFKYNPGTVVALSLKIFRHGATCEGNRAAISFYMRDNVLNRHRKSVQNPETTAVNNDRLTGGESDNPSVQTTGQDNGAIYLLPNQYYLHTMPTFKFGEKIQYRVQPNQPWKQGAYIAPHIKKMWERKHVTVNGRSKMVWVKNEIRLSTGWRRRDS